MTFTILSVAIGFTVFLCIIAFIVCYAVSQQLHYIAESLAKMEIELSALKDRIIFQSQTEEQITPVQESKESVLNWHGLDQSEIDEIKRVDAPKSNDKMIDGVPVLGKGVYNPMTDPASQLKGDVCPSYYN